MLYLGLSDTHEAQLQLLQALTRKFRLHPELNLAKVAAECALNLTGADFYALCADAMLKAMIQKVQDVDDVIRVYLQPATRVPAYHRRLQRNGTSKATYMRTTRILLRLNIISPRSLLHRTYK
jgi:SpoVK/Ycf46/Vps4 family AAA+-type ATPase